MNLTRHKTNKLTAAIGLLVICSSMLVACGGSSDSSDTTAGIGGTGIVSGQITGFGSIHVNGDKFEIDTSQFNVDGDTGADQDDLALGMVVTLEVETENGVYTGRALKVFYDDEIEGPVSTVSLQVGTTKTITVFGQTITIDETSTLFENTTFNDIAIGNVVEVSGFRVSATEINATYLEETAEVVDFGSTEVELRGVIGSYNAGPPEMFVLDTVTINTDGFTEIDVSGPLQNGLNVEVKGIIQNATSILAEKIEEEDEDFDDVDDISLQGIVLVYNGINDFFIGNQRVDASTAKFSPGSLMGMNLQGMNIEAEGEIVGGTLIADEVEARDGETKLRAPVSSVNLGNNSFQVTYPVATGPTTVVVNINGQTLFEDETNTPPVTDPFSLDDLLATDFVRVEGQEVNDEVVASVVKRTDPDSSLNLEGEVDFYNPGFSITILGIEYGLDGDTDYEPDPPNIVIGDFVELEDKDEPPLDLADGIADEVEVE